MQKRLVCVPRAAIVVGLLAVGCASPAPSGSSVAPPVESSGASDSPIGNEPTEQRTEAQVLAQRVLVDIDEALGLERSTSDEDAFAAAIGEWYTEMIARLAEHQPVLASDDAFLPLTHQLLVIRDALADSGNPLALRAMVRELETVRAPLQSIR